MRVVIDGLDGTGKTTTSRLLSDRMGLRYVHFPTKPIPEEIFSKRRTGDFRRDPVYRFFVDDFIDWFRRNGDARDIVFDRFFPSTLLYQDHTDAGEDSMREVLEDILSRTGRIELDRIFLFTADIDTILERLGSRGERHGVFERREKLEKVISKVPLCKKVLEDAGFRVEVVDTTDASIDEVFELVLRLLLHD